MIQDALLLVSDAQALAATGFSTNTIDLGNSTPIVPVHVGDELRCDRIGTLLRASGFHVDAIVFPAIAPGQARLRFMMNAHHTAEQIDGVIDALARLLD